jgi:hypothetical protein
LVCGICVHDFTWLNDPPSRSRSGGRH